MNALALGLALLPLGLTTPVPDAPATDLTGNAYLDICIRAPNCETYTDIHGDTQIRFKPNMEPGSADHDAHFPSSSSSSHSKRAERKLKSSITLGDKKLQWGCGIDPVSELKHIEFACKESGACVTDDPFFRNVQYLEVKDGVNQVWNTQPQDLRLQIESDGSYSQKQRRPLIDAVVTAAATPDAISWHRGIEWSTFDIGEHNKLKHKRETAQIANPKKEKSGKCDLATFTSFVAVTIFDPGEDGGVHSFIKAKVSYPEKKNEKTGFCGQITKILGAMASIVGGPGGSAAGILGLVEASCGD